MTQAQQADAANATQAVEDAAINRAAQLKAAQIGARGKMMDALSVIRSLPKPLPLHGALTIIAELRRAISTGEIEGRSGRPIHLSPTQRRAADNALAELQAIEHHNAFTAPRTGAPYRTRRNALEALHDASPPLKGAVADRLAKARVINAFEAF